MEQYYDSGLKHAANGTGENGAWRTVTKDKNDTVKPLGTAV